jgi:hypothetical protein
MRIFSESDLYAVVYALRIALVVLRVGKEGGDKLESGNGAAVSSGINGPS